MKVYRLERNGIGPFTQKTKGYWVQRTNTKLQKKIIHTQNQVKAITYGAFNSGHAKAIENKDYVFGASSKLMLKAYFSYNLAHFFKQGYRIRAYEVPDNEVIEMGTECAFPVRYHKIKTVKRLESIVQKVS